MGLGLGAFIPCRDLGVAVILDNHREALARRVEIYQVAAFDALGAAQGDGAALSGAIFGQSFRRDGLGFARAQGGEAARQRNTGQKDYGAPKVAPEWGLKNCVAVFKRPRDRKKSLA